MKYKTADNQNNISSDTTVSNFLQLKLYCLQSLTNYSNPPKLDILPPTIIHLYTSAQWEVF